MIALWVKEEPEVQDHKSDEGLRRREEKNTLILFIFVSFVSGFILAIYLGAFIATFARADFKEVPPWLSSGAAIIATLISGYAVYLVSGTLKATTATLEVTQEMARAQRKAFVLEFRPQILVDDAKIVSASHIDGETYEIVIVFDFRNYGKLAALRLEGTIMAGDVDPSEDTNIDRYSGFMGFSMFKRSVLRPGGDFSERVVLKEALSAEKGKIISSRILYWDENGLGYGYPENTYYILRLCGDSVEIKEAGPFEVFSDDDVDKYE